MVTVDITSFTGVKGSCTLQRSPAFRVSLDPTRHASWAKSE
jgi:hypothetical protein